MPYYFKITYMRFLIYNLSLKNNPISRSINKPTSLYLPVKESPTTKIKQQSPTRKTSKNKRKLPNSEQKKQELVTKECDSRMRSKGKRKLRDSIEDEQEVRATKKHKTQVQPDDVKIDNYDSNQGSADG